METTAYLFALTGGFLGGFGHCIGMCGPVVAGYTLGRSKGGLRTAFVPQVLYNAGRILTYTAVGALMGAAGSVAGLAGRAAGLQHMVMIAAGVLMVMMGAGIVVMRSASFLERHNSLVLRAASSLVKSPSILKFFPLGLVLGLIPCGLSYTYFIAAAGTGSPVSGALVMLLFGAGTLPAMFAFGAVVSVLGSRARGTVYRLGGMVVVAMGVVFVYRGIMFYAQM